MRPPIYLILSGSSTHSITVFEKISLAWHTAYRCRGHRLCLALIVNRSIDYALYYWVLFELGENAWVIFLFGYNTNMLDQTLQGWYLTKEISSYIHTNICYPHSRSTCYRHLENVNTIVYWSWFLVCLFFQPLFLRLYLVKQFWAITFFYFIWEYKFALDCFLQYKIYFFKCTPTLTWFYPAFSWILSAPISWH